MKQATATIKRGALALSLACLAALAAAAPAGAEFGLHDLGVAFTDSAGAPSMAAGTHPHDWTMELETNTVGEGTEERPEDAVKQLIIDMPPGLVVNPTAVPTCSAADFAITGSDTNNKCSDATAVGVVGVRGQAGNPDLTDFGAIYNLDPPPGSAAKLGFHILGVAVTIEAGLRSEGQQNAYAVVTGIPQAEPFFGSVATIWGNPFSPEHDSERGKCLLTKGNCPVPNQETALVTLPTRCTGPLVTTFKVDSWQNPGTFVEDKAETADTTDCDDVTFSPNIAASTTNPAAESPTGLDFDLEFDDPGLLDPSGTAQSHVKKAVVTLPQGVTINPSQAEGLAVCSEAQFKAERADSEPGEGCPQASKIGSIEVDTPLLEEQLGGDIFVAEPYRNRFGTLLALYMVVRQRDRGILVRLAGKVEPDPVTGRLTTTFDDLPQQPFSRFHFHFRGGERSPLVTPPTCGKYLTEAVFTPWADPTSTFTVTAPFEVTSGPGGTPCSSGATPFRPGFEAGTLSNGAGSFSPLVMRLTRNDGDQELSRFSVDLPPGLLAKLAGVAQCPELAIAAARGRTGAEELAAPSCPASSQVGSVRAGAGVGNALTYVSGAVYLAGPYNGAPLSAVGVVPAVAGPFDIGVVVTRFALRIDPRSAEVTIDEAASDPLPRILAGIPLRVREIQASVDRPQFTLNPTSCEPFAVGATLWGGGDSSLALSSRFQAANCAGLGFRPQLSLRLKGGTKRRKHPALVGTYRPRPGDANLQGLAVRLPHSAFLEQGHIRTICTRVQFAADACPPAAIYGKATAWTPLLEQPLSGPVYLRSSNNPLPDLVADLRGLIDVEAVARIDSKNGGIRATFTDVPDAPLSKVVVQMQGGKKGLIVNSRDLCVAPNRAGITYAGHNGMRAQGKPVMGVKCGKSKRAR